MILISHRGNVNGSILEKENSLEYIDNAICLGYDVEIDIWYKDNTIWLGHDERNNFEAYKDPEYFLAV